MLPGVLLCLTLAAAAILLGAFTMIPAVFAALLLGFAARPLVTRIAVPESLSLCAGWLLRLGIGLIGVRLSFADLAGLGLSAVAFGVGAVAVMLSLGVLVALGIGLDRSRAVLSAGAVGICGASAALAISAVLPPGPERERQTVATICSVTLLSTAAMLFYPLVAKLTGLSDAQAGIFFGASIHDLTQVIGAGALISPAATEAATVTKLIRVACLAPAALIIGWCFAGRGVARGEARPPLLPWFILMFIAAAIIVNVWAVPASIVASLSELATLCLVTATVALGLTTSLSALVADGWRPVWAVLVQTFILALIALVAIHWLPV